MRKILAAGVLLAALSGVAACSGGDGGDGGGSTSAESAASALAKLSADDKAAVDAVSAKLRDEGSDVGEVGEEERNCVGVALVKNLGATRVLQLAEQDELLLPQAEAEKAAEAFLSCIDVQALFAAGMADGGEMSQKSADCLAGKVSKDAYRAMVVSMFTGDEQAAEADLMAMVMKGMADCLSADEMTGLGK